MGGAVVPAGSDPHWHRSLVRRESARVQGQPVRREKPFSSEDDGRTVAVMTYAERAMWTGFTPGTTAPASGVYADSGAVANGLRVMRTSVASHFLR